MMALMMIMMIMMRMIRSEREGYCKVALNSLDKVDGIWVLLENERDFETREFRIVLRNSLVLHVRKEYTLSSVELCRRRSNEMAISYNKLWKLLVDKKMSKADLRKAAGIAPNTMTRLRRDEEVTLSVLKKICRTLEVDIGDIMEFLPDSADESGEK